jgi:hypothetical protein
MAVDHLGNAWVLYNTGELFLVDTTTAACQATSFAIGQQGFTTFGMGFSVDAPGAMHETLFLASDATPNQLGSVDIATLTVMPIAPLSGTPELTGTGDARLWAFFPAATMPRVAQLDKQSGAESNTLMLPALAGTPLAWAFAFWGGDFWLFLKLATNTSTQVHRVDALTGALTTVVTNSGRTIVGAGVSICAPLR